MREYIEPMDERILTVGFTNLMRLYLSNKYGESIAHSFNEVYDRFNNIELLCPRCNRAYSIDGGYCSDPKYIDGKLFHQHQGKVKVVFEVGTNGMGEMGSPRVLCGECDPQEAFKTFKQYGAKCKHCETILDKGEIGNERKDIIDVYLLKTLELENQKDVGDKVDTYCSTGFLEGMLSARNIVSIRRLVSKRFVEKRSIPKDKSFDYKITPSGEKHLEKIIEPLRKDKLDDRIEECMIQRRENDLSDSIDISNSLKHVVGILTSKNKIKDSRLKFRTVHIVEDQVKNIINNDHVAYWNGIIKVKANA